MPDNPRQFRRGRPDTRRRRAARRPLPQAPAQGQTAQFVITPKPTQMAATRQAEPDYSYVMKDLKNIAALVGGIVVVYLVLFFVWK